MKKKGLLTAILLVLASVVLAIPTQLGAAVQALTGYDSLIGPVITVEQIPSSGNLGDEIFIPAPSSMGAVVTVNDTNKTYTNETSGYVYKLEVTRAKEGNIALTLATENGIRGWKFKANYTGTYTYKYVAESTKVAGSGKTISTVSPAYSVVITGPAATITLPENSIYTVPSILPVNTSVKFPAAIVNKDGSTGVTTAYLIRNGVKIKTFTDSDIQTDTNGVKYYSAYNLDTVGTYTLTYQYQVGTSEPVSLVKTYTVKSNYDISKLELTLNITNTPTTATLGVGQTLPKPTVVDVDGNTIEAYIKIEAYKLINDTDSVAVNGTINDFTFTANEAGDYKIYYTAIANYGSTTVESSRKSFKLTGVKDNMAPTSSAVNDYQMGSTGLSVDGITAVKINGTFKTIQEIFFTADGVNYTAETFAALSDVYKREVLIKALGNLSYAIPSTAVVGTAITIPAIYATDNYSVFGSSVNGIEVVRQVKFEGSNTVQPIKDGENVVFSGSSATYTFTTAGTHTIRYYAKDKNSNNNEEVELASYTIIVTDSAIATSTPVIKLPTVPASVAKTDKISFTMTAPTDSHDQRVEYHVYWSFINDLSTKTVEELASYELIAEDGKYEIDLSAYEEANMGTDGAVYLYIRAINDGGTVATASDDIQIKNVGLNKDSVSPVVVTEDSAYISSFKTANGLGDSDELVFSQGTQINLPDYSISDNMGASMNIAVTNEYGKGVRVKNSAPSATTIVGGTEYEISNAYFVASSGGVHYITYYAIDGGNNVVAKTFAIEITIDNASPDYIQTDALPTTIEKGVYYELPKLVMKNGSEAIDTTLHTVVLFWEVNSPIEMFYDYNGTTLIGFKALETTGDGEYIEFIAKGSVDSVDVTPKTYRKTTVTDTIKPTLTPETYYVLPAEIEYTAGMEIFLPNYEAVDKYSKGNIIETIDIETIDNVAVTAKKGSTDATVTAVTEDLYARENGSSGISITRYKFTPSSSGTWTITYSATDESGLVSTATLTIKVGDCDAPELTWNNKATDLITKATVGDSYELKLDFFKIFDRDTEDMTDAEYLAYLSSSENVNIYLSDPDSATVTNALADATNKGYKWTFDKAGTYKLYFKLTDETKNTQTYSYNITVSAAEEGTQEDKNDVVGIVLITIACIIVAGIIIYFIYAGIKSSKNKGRKKQISEKDDEKIVK